MRWQGGKRSTNIDDRRGQRGGGRTGTRLRFGLLGTVGVVVVGLFAGVEPSTLFGFVTEEGGAPTSETAPAPRSAEEDQLADMVAVVLGDTEDTWTRLFAEQGQTYQQPTLVFFTEAVQSACGAQTAAVGPFYCPGDNQVYIDLGFFEELSTRFGAPGDFAQAYVVAHEVGHHIQNLTGVSTRVHRDRARLSETEANEMSVRQELQADCYAGVWGHHARERMLEPGDLEEGLRAAHAIGDDTLQRQATGTVVPESFTHGSAEQRSRWFRRGFDTGEMAACDTFGAQSL
ncbi:MAG: putative metalloprotease [Bradymonadia bacterium]|jgi:predicted metalloprotease